jgi:hypothetical protein
MQSDSSIYGVSSVGITIGAMDQDWQPVEIPLDTVFEMSSALDRHRSAVDDSPLKMLFALQSIINVYWGGQLDAPRIFISGDCLNESAAFHSRIYDASTGTWGENACLSDLDAIVFWGKVGDKAKDKERPVIFLLMDDEKDDAWVYVYDALQVAKRDRKAIEKVRLCRRHEMQTWLMVGSA